jgi:hypothetical protein
MAPWLLWVGLEVSTMSRKFLLGLALCGGLVAEAQPAAAQQTINLSFGYFALRGQDARVSGDVLNANRNFLSFDIKDFNGPTVGGEWLVPLGQYLEAGAGLSFTRRTVPSVYTDFVNADQSEIEQDLRLRTVPIDFTFRLVPLGEHSGFQPYIGGGLSVVNWRYSESGEFIDLTDHSIFQNSYVASGTHSGPVALGGIRFAGDAFSAGAEVRYRSAHASLPAPFAGTAIDLGGWDYQFTIGKRFGR